MDADCVKIDMNCHNSECGLHGSNMETYLSAKKKERLI